ncbi:Fis family transcriptional regulator [Luteolibacter sp. Populi]|uniref:Fis family transcriptional regulator n=1 Tax=Luteolibacter sp. Populi TaxID=3230487 RepID=UPI003466F1AF
MSAKAPKQKNVTPHIGSDFDDFLAEEGIKGEVEALALKKVVSLQLQEILEKEHVSKSQLASRMQTSRTSINRMLDPGNPALTVASLGKVAAALGRKLEFKFVKVKPVAIEKAGSSSGKRKGAVA